MNLCFLVFHFSGVAYGVSFTPGAKKLSTFNSLVEVSKIGSSPNDRFGNSVSLSSDGFIVACGAEQDNNGPGYARIYRWSGSVWQQQGSTLMGFSANDDFALVQREEH